MLAPGATAILPPTTPPTVVHGLRIVGSLFESSDGNRSVVLDERRGRRFAGVSDTVIERGAARVQPTGLGRRLLGTRATLTRSLRNATRAEFEFASQLVFGKIREVRFSLSLESGFARSAARWTPGESTVVVETDVPVTGTCTVDVDESERDKW